MKGPLLLALLLLMLAASCERFPQQSEDNSQCDSVVVETVIDSTVITEEMPDTTYYLSDNRQTDTSHIPLRRHEEFIAHEREVALLRQQTITAGWMLPRHIDAKTPEEAYDEGYDDGYLQGLEDGQNGEESGCNFDDGCYYDNEAMIEAYAEGYQDGYYYGYEEGHEDDENEHSPY